MPLIGLTAANSLSNSISRSVCVFIHVCVFFGTTCAFHLETSAGDCPGAVTMATQRME